MNSGPVGFGGAPVSKAILLIASGASIFLRSAGDVRNGPVKAIADLTQPLQFRGLGELIFGAALLYYFRILERQRGSERYGSLVFTTLGIDALVHWLLRSKLSWKFAASPYCIIASNFVSFAVEIPVVQKFPVLGCPFTDKAIIYALGGQALLSASRHSLSSVIVGILVGAAYQSNLWGLKRLKLPEIVSRTIGRSFGWIFGRSSERARIIVGASTTAGQQHRTAVIQPQVAVSEEALAQLVSMGFGEEQARGALQHSRNDVAAALSSLL